MDAAAAMNQAMQDPKVTSIVFKQIVFLLFLANVASVHQYTKLLKQQCRNPTSSQIQKAVPLSSLQSFRVQSTMLQSDEAIGDEQGQPCR